MKYKTLLRIVLAVTAWLFVFTAFGSTPQITMTTVSKERINIYARGSGIAAVDWGDGKSDTCALSKDSSALFTHIYSITTAHTVTITGNLIALDCSENQITATKLNALFGTLHNNTIIKTASGSGDIKPGTEKEKHIYIYGNPGTDTCNKSIAAAKGWWVYTTD